MYLKIFRNSIMNNYENETISALKLISADLKNQFKIISANHEEILNCVENFESILTEIDLNAFEKLN